MPHFQSLGNPLRLRPQLHREADFEGLDALLPAGSMFRSVTQLVPACRVRSAACGLAAARGSEQ
jgi:hypothetical protein